MILSVFCASHITSEKNFQHVIRMLRSIENQTYRTKLWISVSHASNQDYNAIGDWFQEHVPTGTQLIRAKSIKSQFEHFNLLMNAYRANHITAISDNEMYNQWIAFINDDDTIGMNRMERFSNLIHNSTIVNDSMFLREAVKIQRQELDDPEPECWDFCVTARLLCWWLQRVGPQVRHSKYADMFFNYFLEPREDKSVVLDYAVSKPCSQYHHTQNRSEVLLKTGTLDEDVWKAMMIHLYTTQGKFTDESCIERIFRECPLDYRTQIIVHTTVPRLRREKSAEFEAMRNVPHLEEYLRDHPQQIRPWLVDDSTGMLEQA